MAIQSTPSRTHHLSPYHLVTGRPVHLGVSPLTFCPATCRDGKILQGIHVLNPIINRWRLPSYILNSLGLLLILKQEISSTGRDSYSWTSLERSLPGTVNNKYIVGYLAAPWPLPLWQMKLPSRNFQISPGHQIMTGWEHLPEGQSLLWLLIA